MLNPNSEAATVLPLGSTGDPPVPTGDPPVGTGGRVRTFPDGWFHGQSSLRSVGPVAQQNGQVARATRAHCGIQIQCAKVKPMTPATAMSAPISECRPIFSPSTMRVMGSSTMGEVAMMAATMPA